MEPRAEEGAATSSGSVSMRGEGVGIGDRMCTWHSATYDSLISPQGPGPKELGTGPQRPGTVLDTSLLVQPKASPGRAFPGRTL